MRFLHWTVPCLALHIFRMMQRSNNGREETNEYTGRREYWNGNQVKIID